MYTFNRIDKRLERLQQIALFVFEALDGLQDDYDYSVVAHSGNGPEAELFVGWGPQSKPKTPKDRWSVCQRMAAHAQYCSPGDHTLDGTAAAIKDVVRDKADEYFARPRRPSRPGIGGRRDRAAPQVFLISDADLKRYGIDAANWNSVIMRDPKVQAFVILISSNDEEANEIQAKIHPGRAVTCFDTAKLPTTFKEIFASRVLKLS